MRAYLLFVSLLLLPAMLPSCETCEYYTFPRGKWIAEADTLPIEVADAVMEVNETTAIFTMEMIDGSVETATYQISGDGT